jgi:flagellar protein FlbT
MSLKLRLKPHEKLLIGHAVVRNGDKAALLFIENSVPILREKDIMKEEDATSTEQRLYFLIQLMYVDQDDLPRYLDLFQGQVTSLLQENPAMEADLVALTRLVGDRDYYNALKAARRLMEQQPA